MFLWKVSPRWNFTKLCQSFITFLRQILGGTQAKNDYVWKCLKWKVLHNIQVSVSFYTWNISRREEKKFCILRFVTWWLMDGIMCVVHNGAPSFYTFHTELSFVVGSSQNSLNLMKGVEIFRLNRNKPGQAAVLIKVRKQTRQLCWDVLGEFWNTNHLQSSGEWSTWEEIATIRATQQTPVRCSSCIYCADWLHCTVPMDLPRKIVFLAS